LKRWLAQRKTGERGRLADERRKVPVNRANGVFRGCAMEFKALAGLSDALNRVRHALRARYTAPGGFADGRVALSR
jgi:hypothetical protein